MKSLYVSNQSDVLKMNFKSRTAKTIITTALVASIVILALALVVHMDAAASTASSAGTLNTAATQTPTVPDLSQPGCYMGTVNPFTIVQVPCQTNLPPVGALYIPTSTTSTSTLSTNTTMSYTSSAP